VTREREDVGLLPVRVGSMKKLGVIRHALTHRRYEFAVLGCEAIGAHVNATWVTLEELDRYPMPRPHVKVAGML